MPSLRDATRGRLLYGGDYNPEQWPREVWDEDVRLMREAGVNLATVGVFSWAVLEPRPGEYDFGWLDEVLDLLHANGIGVALATPTASAPPWLHRRWPETSPQDRDRTVRTYGSRNAYCPSSPVYRRFANAISGQLADRYAGHPALRMWHIGNEFGTVCYCDGCAEAFRGWLHAKYRTVAALNEAWGTSFWSQRYDAWDEVIPPRKVQYLINPAQEIDYQRFASDLLLEGFTTERDIVGARNPAIPVTTNFTGFFKGTDSWKWVREEDFASLDSYPDPNDPAGACRGAFAHDLTRSLGRESRGGGWLLMEQSTGGVGWRPISTPKGPGLYRLWSIQAVARGADGVLQFQWRASKQGAERTHSAMVPHAGERSRVFREVCGLGRELAGLAGVLGTPVAADVAIMVDWDAWRAVELEHQPHQGFSYVDRIYEYYEQLWRANITCDFVRAQGELGRYRLVVVPNLYQITDAASANLERYTEAGGTLVVGPFSAVTDEDERVRLGATRPRSATCSASESRSTGRSNGTWNCAWSRRPSAISPPGPGPSGSIGRRPARKRSRWSRAVRWTGIRRCWRTGTATASPGTSRRCRNRRRSAACCAPSRPRRESSPYSRTCPQGWRPYGAARRCSCSTIAPARWRYGPRSARPPVLPRRTESRIQGRRPLPRSAGGAPEPGEGEWRTHAATTNGRYPSGTSERNSSMRFDGRSGQVSRARSTLPVHDEAGSPWRKCRSASPALQPPVLSDYTR